VTWIWKCFGVSNKRPLHWTNPRYFCAPSYHGLLYIPDISHLKFTAWEWVTGI